MTARQGPVDVPMAWLCTQDAVFELITCVKPRWPRASFEFRATRDVLTLTLLFADQAGSGSAYASADPHIVARLLAHEVDWAVWCHHQLTAPAAVLTETDISMATSAWDWLSGSRLLSDAAQEWPGSDLWDWRFHGTGVALGVTRARQIVEGLINQRRRP